MRMDDSKSSDCTGGRIGKEILKGAFRFNTEDTVICKYCKKEFRYHNSNSSLSYHLRTKHAFADCGTTLSPSRCNAAASAGAADVPDKTQPTLLQVT